MKTVIWIPFRGDGGGWRDKNFRVVAKQAKQVGEALGAPVIVHDSGDEPFSVARTWNQMPEASGDWDSAICWGADFLLVDPLESLTAALRKIEQGSHYVFAFDKVSTLTRDQTLLVHRTGARTFPASRLPFGGVRAISREMWERVGGYDPRFKGWGHEDRAHVHGVRLFYGERERVSGHMLNLWHLKRYDAPNAAYFLRAAENKALLGEVERITTTDEWDEYLRNRG